MASRIADDDYLNLVLDTIGQGIFAISPDWTITTFNRAAEAITGHSAAQARGRKCFELLRADLCEGDCPLRRAMTERRAVRDVRTTIRRRDGAPVSIALSASALVAPDGSLLGGIETFEDMSAIDALRKQVDGSWRFDDIIAKSPAMQRVVRMLGPVAESDAQVLITGPSGSGKELVARAVHNHSHRRDAPFIAVNCAALPETLLESELFGYVRGAFTGAARDKPGRIAAAQGGTLFLDEVGDLQPALQAKTLRFLQEKTYEPLGSNVTQRADVRVVSATNRVLECMVAEGVFREDLYYRLNVVGIALPALCERREDLPLLIQHFVDRFRSSTGKDVRGVGADAMAALMRHHYPGNVRELENIIERAFIFTEGRSIGLDALPEHVRTGETGGASGAAGPPVGIRGVQADAIRRALERHRGNRSRAARELGIHRSTLLRKLRELGLR